MNTPLLRVLSLGAGVQSSTLYLMALAGEFDHRPEVAIFADTQWGPRATYEWLHELERIGGQTIPIMRVSVGNLRDDVIRGVNRKTRIANIPFFTQGADGRASLLRRTCTSEYKITPIGREVRRLLDARRDRAGITGRLPPGSVEQWIGISRDEASRMKDSRVAYIQMRWPLIEKNMTRRDCLDWLALNGYPKPPKSACIGCPFHDDKFWRDMKDNRPDEWRDAVEFDAFIRQFGSTDQSGVMRGMRKGGEAYLHRSLKPLSKVDLSTAEERGQPNLFENECEGMCGV